MYTIAKESQESHSSYEEFNEMEFLDRKPSNFSRKKKTPTGKASKTGRKKRKSGVFENLSFIIPSHHSIKTEKKRRKSGCFENLSFIIPESTPVKKRRKSGCFENLSVTRVSDLDTPKKQKRKEGVFENLSVDLIRHNQNDEKIVNDIEMIMPKADNADEDLFSTKKEQVEEEIKSNEHESVDNIDTVVVSDLQPKVEKEQSSDDNQVNAMNEHVSDLIILRDHSLPDEIVNLAQGSAPKLITSNSTTEIDITKESAIKSHMSRSVSHESILKPSDDAEHTKQQVEYLTKELSAKVYQHAELLKVHSEVLAQCDQHSKRIRKQHEEIAQLTEENEYLKGRIDRLRANQLTLTLIQDDLTEVRS